MGSSPRPCGCRNVHSDVKLKDPFTLAQKDLKSLYDDIRKVPRQEHGRILSSLLLLETVTYFLRV